MSVHTSAISPTDRAHRSAVAGATRLGRAARAVARFFGGISADYRVGRAIRQMHALSDETLHDIGIHRSEIASLVHGLEFDRVERRHG